MVIWKGDHGRDAEKGLTTSAMDTGNDRFTRLRINNWQSQDLMITGETRALRTSLRDVSYRENCGDTLRSMYFVFLLSSQTSIRTCSPIFNANNSTVACEGEMMNCHDGR